MNENHDWTYQPAADVELAPLQRMNSVRREPGLVSSIACTTATHIMRAYFLLYHRWRITGRAFLPQSFPFVVIANHTSHLDAPLLAAAIPKAMRAHTFPVAAGDVFFTSPQRSMISSTFLNALPLWRKKVTTHAIADLRQRLAQGNCGLILFPEGGRSRDGAIMPLKLGLGMLVAESTVPVVPCHINGAFEALSAGRCLPLPSPIHLRFGPALTFREAANDRDGWAHIAESAHQAVRILADAA